MFVTIRAEAYRHTVQRAETNKRAWDAGVLPVEYKTNDHVLVRAEGQRKYKGNWFGPYTVVYAAPLNTYQLKTPQAQILERLISGDRLRRACVSGRIIQGWHMPKGESCRRLENNPALPITVADDTFEPLPPGIDNIKPIENVGLPEPDAEIIEPQV